jgi:cytochrome oxidase Cu insertion factor (SCO1/SenC/PrrC family)
MSSRSLRALQLLFLVCAVAAVIVFARAVRDGESRRAPETLVQYLGPNYTGENRLAPDFELVDRHGTRHRLSALRGKVVVLHFWTRTCEPCIDELQRSIPAFDEIVRSRNDLALVTVTIDANWEAIAPLVPPGLQAPILFDPERTVVSGRYGTQLFPETWVIDPRGVIRARFDHPLEWDSPLLISYLDSLK